MDFDFMDNPGYVHVYEDATHGQGDDYTAHLFDQGWGHTTAEVGHHDREVARMEFFDWIEEMGYDVEDFDWEAWREAYNEATAG